MGFTDINKQINKKKDMGSKREGNPMQKSEGNC